VTPGVRVSLCGGCGWSGLPEREWCPSCGLAEPLRTALVHAGHVEDATIVRRMVGGGPSVRLGTVRLGGGARIVCRLLPDATAGAWVRLFSEDGVAIAGPA
jgi:uncharacterized OB-fold protein